MSGRLGGRGPIRARWRRTAGVAALVLGLSVVAAPGPSGSATSAPREAASSVRSAAVSADPIWRPTTSRPLALHWVLGRPLDLRNPRQMGRRTFSGRRLKAPDVYDIDLEFNSAKTVQALQARGKKVICYIDVGVFETYRTDADRFRALSPRIWGNPDEGWDGSYWLDIRRIAELEPIMRARIQACKDKGFDAVEPDEMTGYSNDSGFPLTYADQLAYNKAVAGWAHEIGISVGMKGDLEQAHDLAPYFDWFLVEECFEYAECTGVHNLGPGADGAVHAGVQSFTSLGKAVWVAEYRSYSRSRWRSICKTARAYRLNVARYRLGLPNRGGRMPCPKASARRW